jgi:hypothetical protein
MTVGNLKDYKNQEKTDHIMREMNRLEIKELEPVEVILPDVVPDVVVPDVQEFLIGGRKYILDTSKLKTQEDVLNVIKHFSTRVELHVFEIEGIERYVKPISNTQTH